MQLYNKIADKINELNEKSGLINPDREELLNSFARYISQKIKDGKEINLIFICTHNSRRSQISQIWAQTAGAYYNIPNLKSYSGGTEATAFNPRAVKAMKKAGFTIERMDDSDNPIYQVHYSEYADALKCYSKVYSDPFNPQKEFAAIMTCSDADEECPVVFGAEKRFPIRYEDPKKFDGTGQEENKYNERVNQIGIEMLFVFSKVEVTK